MIERFASWGIGFDGEGQPNLGITIDGQHNRTETLNVVFQKKADVVRSAIVKVEYYYVLAEQKFDEAWKPYTLPRILSSYGIPDQVFLDFTTGAGDWSPGIREYYRLWLVYDNLGFAIRYTGWLIRDNHDWLLCPVFSLVGGIEIHLRSPGDRSPLIDTSTSEYAFGFVGALTELTGATLDEFYDTFSQFPPQVCLSVSDPAPGRFDTVVLPSNPILLSPKDEDSLLINRLSNTAGCELPCWWGIRPGDTSLLDAQQVFLGLGKSVSSRQERDFGTLHMVALFGRHSPYPFDYVVEHRFFERDDKVYLLGVTGYSLGWSPPQHFTQDWRHYSLDQVLARFGQPDQVLLHYWDFGWQYSIGLVYEGRGVLIQYVGKIVDNTPYEREMPITICPTQNRPTAISMWLTGTDTGFHIADAFSQFGYVYPDSMPFSSTPSLETASGMPVKVFYETYRNPDTQVCLKVPRDLGDMAP